MCLIEIFMQNKFQWIWIKFICGKNSIGFTCLIHFYFFIAIPHDKKQAIPARNESSCIDNSQTIQTLCRRNFILPRNFWYPEKGFLLLFCHACRIKRKPHNADSSNRAKKRNSAGEKAIAIHHMQTMYILFSSKSQIRKETQKISPLSCDSECAASKKRTRLEACDTISNEKFRLY